VRGIGAEPAEVFANAARATTAVLVPLVDIECDQAVEFASTAPDLEVLLVDWLNVVTYERRRALAPMICIKG
jgi:SHS2 domain-containing protein